MVVLARYVLASLRRGERFAVNVLAICRKGVMGPLTHLALVFSELRETQWVVMKVGEND